MPQDYLNTAATVSFEMAVEFQLNELDHEFETMCNFKGGTSGEKVEITDRFSDLVAKQVDERLGKTELQDSSIERRWIHKQNRIAVHTALDPDDQMATEIPLDSPLAVGVARSIKIARQDQFLIGFYGNAYTGKEGTTAVPFASSQVFAADTGETPGTMTGLTLKKMTAIRKKARQNLINPRDPMNKLHWGVSAEEIEDLLRINEYISRDYNPDSQSSSPGLSRGAQQALQDGEPTPFMGIIFEPMEFTNTRAFPSSAALTVNGSGHRRCPIWIPSGMAGREWMTVESHRDMRPDMNHAWQFSAYTNLRYSRIYEDKCFIVECA